MSPGVVRAQCEVSFLVGSWHSPRPASVSKGKTSRANPGGALASEVPAAVGELQAALAISTLSTPTRSKSMLSLTTAGSCGPLMPSTFQELIQLRRLRNATERAALASSPRAPRTRHLAGPRVRVLPTKG